MSDKAKNNKKKKSQAPVALVYFATMMVFLAVFAVFAVILLGRMNIQSEQEDNEPVSLMQSYNILYAGVNSGNELADLALVRMAPEMDQIIITPCSSLTVSVTDGVSTFGEIYADGGMTRLVNAVEQTFRVETDYYMSLTSSAFESVADILGGMVYTPEEDLYYLSQEDASLDVSYRAGGTVSLSGREINLICQSPVFSQGRGGNVEFMGEALYQLVNGAFQQNNITRNNLDNIYNIMSADSDTNLTDSVMEQHKSYMTEMLSRDIEPAVLLVPDGTWTNDSYFTVSDEFRTSLAEAYERTSTNSGVVSSESDAV